MAQAQCALLQVSGKCLRAREVCTWYVCYSWCAQQATCVQIAGQKRAKYVKIL